MAKTNTNGRRELKPQKYIQRRARNGRKREKHIGASVYGVEREKIQRQANTYARQHLGYMRMSVGAYINLRLLLP